MATAEIAVALPALVLITAIALWGLTAASVQLACTDAARTGARAAARGESLTAVRELVVKAVPQGATVRVSRDEATVHVDVSAPVKPPAGAGLPPLTVRAHVAAATEPGVPPDEQGPDEQGGEGGTTKEAREGGATAEPSRRPVRRDEPLPTGRPAP